MAARSVADHRPIAESRRSRMPLRTAAASRPAVPSDRYFSSDPRAVNVVTFNTAGDGCEHTPEQLIPDSAVFQSVIHGAPDAPIIACQETTPILAKTLQDAARNGNFQVVYPGQSWFPNVLPTSELWQGNMVLIPKRYKVLSVAFRSFDGRAGNVWSAIKGVLSGHGSLNDLAAALEDRGCESIYLHDTRTGHNFTVIATHVAFLDQLRSQEAPQLVKWVNLARKRGPVVLMGDFNTPTLDTNLHPDAHVVAFWRTMQGAHLKDLGPRGQAGITDWGAHENIDQVLGSGFSTEQTEVLSGNRMTIPGRPDAKAVSDHYAKAASLVFAG